MRFVNPASIAAVVFISSGVQAGVVVSSDESVWGMMNAMSSLQVATESFSAIGPGVYPTISGSTGGVAWSLSAPGGVRAGAGAVASSATGSSLSLSFAGGVSSFAGRFFSVDSSFLVQAAMFTVTLSNGTGYTAVATNAAGFAGFSGTNGERIMSITVSAMGLRDAQPVAPAIDELYFGVIPAPGPWALAASAGALGARRRRR